MGYIGEGINQTATSVETAKDEFFGTYYGQISSDPTVDPNGEAITDGDLFYNTSEEALKIRVNGEWLSLRTATTGYQQFTATSGQTTFNVAGSFSPGFVFVTLNGVVLASGDYDDSSGTSIVLTSGAADGDILGVYLFDTFSVADTVSASAGGTFSGPVDFSESTNTTIIVDSTSDTSPNSALDGGAVELSGRGWNTSTGSERYSIRLESYANYQSPTFGQSTPGLRIKTKDTNDTEATPFDFEPGGDLYLSGGIYLGGTGSANYLDDYEEGSFTPTIKGSTTAGTGTYGVQEGYYEKVGNMIHVQGYISWTSHTGTGKIRLVMPFSSANLTNGYAVVSFTYIRNLSTSTNTYSTGAFLSPNSNTANLQETPVGGGSNNDVDMDTNAQFMFSCTYRVN